MRGITNVEMVFQNSQMTNGYSTTISGHFVTNYMDNFHKTEIQTVILRCLTCLNWFKSYETKHKYLNFNFFM